MKSAKTMSRATIVKLVIALAAGVGAALAAYQTMIHSPPPGTVSTSDDKDPGLTP